MRKWQSVVAVAVVCLLAGAGVVEAEVLTELDRIRPYDVDLAGFSLDSEQTLEISAMGYRHGSSRDDLQMTSAWILDADSREVVWTLRDAESDRAGRHLREYSSEVTLPAGRYEVYFEAVPTWGNYDDDDDDDDWNWGGVFNRRNWGGWDMDDFEDVSDEYFIRVEGRGSSWSKKEILAHHEAITKDALFSQTTLRDDHYEKASLKLDRDMDLEIYAIGEATRDGNYDTSWIMDTATREKVWMLDYRESDRAGGVKKNRMFREKIKLPKGNYAIFVATDDSHSTEDWNGTPPYDPYFWGITITVDDGMAQYASVGEYEEVSPENVIVEMVELRNDEYKSKGFTLKQDTKLRVHALGEGFDDDMADYSWIIDADTRKRVWEFEHYQSEHAGGASKNREIDEVIELDAGNYIAYAVTDDSHAYRRWNASPPHDQSRWGLTIATVEAGDRKLVVEFEEGEDEDNLVQITRVRNNEDLRERFTLDKDATVRVYALGEGSDGRMYDYAWIENAETGKVVWEMTYRRTEHAGGARKNRVYNDTIKLEKGEYVVYYESDDSHSYNRWNASPPADFQNWGVTVRIAKGK